MRAGTTLLTVALLATPGVSCAGEEQQFRARVVAVEDGDTLRVQRGQGDVRIRIFGIDAPEATQPFGPEARDAARQLLLNRTVEVALKDVDQYGRLVAALSVNGRDIGAELITAGAAWNYGQFSQDDRFATLESDARAAKRGLWTSPNPVPPWIFRSDARRRDIGPAGARGPTVGAIHGNATSRVFHAPGCENYTCANCTVIFEDAAAATAAGYRPHAACVR